MEYEDESDSDEGECFGGAVEDSSDEEDDLQTVLRGGSAVGSSCRGAASALCALGEEDSFEDEVRKEFDATFALVEHDAGLKALPSRVKKDPLYDPRQDGRDEAWMNAKRRKYQPRGNRKGSEAQKLPHSDAVLNCPCCMTMICLDCQRHEKFSNQYRAMFVFNCTVDFEQTMKIPASADKKELKKLKWKDKKKIKNGQMTLAEFHAEAASPETPVSGSGEGIAGPSTSSGSSVEVKDDFHPVSCSICGTRVAVYDSEEVYHFFHVLASHS